MIAFPVTRKSVPLLLFACFTWNFFWPCNGCTVPHFPGNYFPLINNRPQIFFFVSQYFWVSIVQLFYLVFPVAYPFNAAFDHSSLSFESTFFPLRGVDRTSVVRIHVQWMSRDIPKYVPKCSEMAVRHTNVPGSVDLFASIGGPPEWVPDRIQGIFVLLMFRNVPKYPPKKSLMSQNLSRNVPKCPKLEKGQCLLLCLWFNLSTLMSWNAPHRSQQVLKWSQNW